MSKFGLYSQKSPIPFETHLEGLDDQTREALLTLRTFVTGLGTDVVEEVRPHRIVYAKSLTFRTFLDVLPKKDSLVITVKKSRHEATTEYMMRSEDLEHVKHQVAMAYNLIK